MNQLSQEEIDEEEQLEKEIKNISALSIQLVWKKYKTLKALRQTLISKREPIVVYFSSMASNYKVKQEQMQLFQLLKIKNIKFYQFDLVDNKMAQGWVKEYLNRYSLPFITINNIYIGGYDDFQGLHELKILPQIVNKDYERECLFCHKPKEGNACPDCKYPYDFFRKQ